MIIKSVKTMPESQAESFVWTRLRRFQNVSYVKDLLIDLHQVPAKYKSNVRKQAEQIRFCLIQAEEYFMASRHVSLATRPLLHYYGTMSLALAEILLKQSGESSLDVARAKHAHHGLTLKVSGDPSKQENLSQSLTMLKAVPHVHHSERIGTFHLWHSSSRELPIAGREKSIHPDHHQTRVSTVCLATDTPFPEVPTQGKTLFDCFVSLPEMAQVIGESGISAKLARTTPSLTIDNTNNSMEAGFIVHPLDPAHDDLIFGKFIIPPNDFELFNFVKPVTGGYIINMSFSKDFPQSGSSFPMAFQSKPDIAYFTSEYHLNEFGLLYVGSFILGNYARYYPDQWMRDVDSTSQLSIAVWHFSDIISLRAPFLCMCELSRCLYLFD